MKHRWLGDLDAPLNSSIGASMPINYNKSVDTLVKKEKKVDFYRKLAVILRWLKKNG